MNNAIAIEFDCWQDGSKNDVNYNHISINVKSGAADSNDFYSIAKQANPPNFSVHFLIIFIERKKRKFSQ